MIYAGKIAAWVLFALIGLFQGMGCIAQETAVSNYDYFEQLIEENSGDSVKAASFAGAWLKKAKSEQNWPQQVRAYNAFIHYAAQRTERASLADSMLVAAQRSGEDGLIGAAYLKKGLLVAEKNKKIALGNYLLADKYISRTTDRYLVHKVKYVVAETKFYLGFYHEALSLFLECLNYFETENDRGYINTLHAISLCYNRLGNIRESDKMIARGREMANKLEVHQMDRYFDLSSAVNEFYKKNYRKSMESLSLLFPFLESRRDLPGLTAAHFYMGRNLWEVGEKESAVYFLKKVDTAFSHENILRPDLRKTYELLIDYHRSTSNIEMKDHYIERLLHADRILDRNFEYLSGRVHKEYDTAKLLAEQKEKESSRRNYLYWIIGGVSGALCLSLAVNVYVRRRNRYYFKLAMDREPQKEKEEIESVAREQKIILTGSTLDNLLDQLREFESGKKYLEKNMKASDMAKLFRTNPKYISELVKHYRGKRFTEYINDLRIDHVVELLKTQNKFRNYTNEALAVEAGFGSTQIFTRAFKKRVRISPTTFVNEIGQQCKVL